MKYFINRGFGDIHMRYCQEFSNFVDSFFQTPLHFAAENRKGDIVRILLRNGANSNEEDVRNQRDKKRKRCDKIKKENAVERGTKQRVVFILKTNILLGINQSSKFEVFFRKLFLNL